MIKPKGSFILRLLTNPFVILFFILGIFLLITAHQPMGNDEGIWSYMGRVWVNNDLPPYTGTIDNKPPGILCLYAVSYFFYGLDISFHISFIRGIGVLSILLASFLVYVIAKKAHSRQAGILSMIIFGLTMSWERMDGIFVAQTEVFMIFFSILSLYLMIKANDSKKWTYFIFLSGITLGFAIAFKQIALFTALGMFFFFLLSASSSLSSKNKILGIFLLGAGILAGTFISIIPILASGVTVKEYFNGAWLLLQNTGSSAPMKHHIKTFAEIWFNSRMTFFYFILLFFIFKPDLIKTKFMKGFLILLFFDFVGVNASGFYFGHQVKQIIPSLSLISGIVLFILFAEYKGAEKQKNRKMVFLILLLILVCLPFKSLLTSVKIIENDFKNNHDKEIGNWIKKHSTEQDYIYVIGYQGNPILSYSERVSSSKYFNFILCEGEKEMIIIMNDLKTNTPLFIVRPHIYDTWWEEFDNFIYKNYIPFTDLFDYKIYRLRQ